MKLSLNNSPKKKLLTKEKSTLLFSKWICRAEVKTNIALINFFLVITNGIMKINPW